MIASRTHVQQSPTPSPLSFAPIRSDGRWDNCAPVAVAVAHGLHASRLDGSKLIYNCADPLLPDLLICRPEIAALVAAAINAESAT